MTTPQLGHGSPTRGRSGRDNTGSAVGGVAQNEYERIGPTPVSLLAVVVPINEPIRNTSGFSSASIIGRPSEIQSSPGTNSKAYSGNDPMLPLATMNDVICPTRLAGSSFGRGLFAPGAAVPLM